MSLDAREGVQPWIDRWRTYVLAHGGAETHVAVLEEQLRDHAARLGDAGLDSDEAFLVALRRVAADDEASRAFARAYSDELWIHLRETEDEQGPVRGTTTEFSVMLGCAVAAAIAIKVPMLFGYEFDGDGGSLYARNLSLFVLPFLAVYFIWKNGLSKRGIVGLAALFVAAAVFANVYPFTPGGSTEILTAIHLPIALWLAVGVAYVGGDWLPDARRMEYVRFTGEWLVNYALIALGGGVLVAITVGVFEAIGLDAEPFMTEWVLPCGAMGAVIVAAWLVGTRRNLVGGMAPMLARVFTPLFALMLVALLVGVVWTRGFIDVEREVLILFDLLLVVVLALLLYAISARDPLAEPGLFDWIQLVLVGCALAVDVFALINIAARLTEYGFSANRTAAIGLNLILLVNLAWSAFLQAGFLRSRRSFEHVERWQMRYLPVYAAVGGDRRRRLPAAVRLRLIFAGGRPLVAPAVLRWSHELETPVGVGRGIPAGIRGRCRGNRRVHAVSRSVWRRDIHDPLRSRDRDHRSLRRDAPVRLCFGTRRARHGLSVHAALLPPDGFRSHGMDRPGGLPRRCAHRRPTDRSPQGAGASGGAQAEGAHASQPSVVPRRVRQVRRHRGRAYGLAGHDVAGRPACCGLRTIGGRQSQAHCLRR